jgi:hypothetical protein
LAVTTAGAFNVEGGTASVDYRYASPTLTVLTSTPLTISMASGPTTTDRIAVASGKSAVLTLDSVSIDVSAIADAPALAVQGGSLTLTLSGTNTLKSGKDRTGLQLGAGANLLVTSDSDGASLEAVGGGAGTGDGSGIGNTGGAGDIAIAGGTIVATAGIHGAGIGGGDIVISGGTVTATGGNGGGAGIGGAFWGATGAITITGGIVTARGSNGVPAPRNDDDTGAGIGGGEDMSGTGDITITGGTVTATGSIGGGAGIGGGITDSSSGAVTITGGTVTATRLDTVSSQDIGNGSTASYDSSNISSVVIDGGSVWATTGAVAYGSGVTGATNSTGVPVFANTLTLGTAATAPDTAVTAGSVDGVPCAAAADAPTGTYGIHDVRTNASSAVCLWLPSTDASTAAVGLVANGAGYEKQYVRPASSSQTTLSAGPPSLVGTTSPGPGGGDTPWLVLGTAALLVVALGAGAVALGLRRRKARR